MVRPLPGDGIVAHAGGLLLVCDAGDAVEGLLAALRETASSGGDGLALARRAAQVLANTMMGEPATCAVAGPCSGGVAVLVSGDAQASVSGGPDGSVQLSGRDSLTWTDRLVAGPVGRIELRLPGAGQPNPHARLDGGVIGGAGLVCDFSESAVPIAPVVPGAGGGMAAGQMSRQSPMSQPQMSQPQASQPQMAQPQMARQAHAAAPEVLPAAQPREPAPLPAPTPSVQPVHEPVSGPAGGHSGPQPGVLSGPMPQTGQQASVGGHAGHSGHAGHAHEDDAMAGRGNGVPSEQVPAGVGPNQPFESVLLLPGQDEPGQDASPAVPESTEYMAEPEPRPMVYGVDCKNDHFNDPRVPYCAVCGIALVQRTLVPYKGPRPPLGVLLLDDGMTLRLDTDYLLGRDPERASEVLSGEARPAKVTSPDGSVSRRHLRVKLDNWDVNLIDLGSVNGTQVQPPGDPNFYDIPPNEPVAILPGTTVRIGVSRTMRYESHRNS
ncbi:FHA domain-containing protein [Thermopolyspora sp. NPDC052614]|uniref:FHA domain-containing protein n=1 Tax=Thermopolyspora sp. NPDC052614 TaxID=3155682 RepID=UPI00343B9300